jgi:hypothetical protein
LVLAYNDGSPFSLVGIKECEGESLVRELMHKPTDLPTNVN